MPPAQPIQIPENLRVVITLAQLLERFERSGQPVSADQYRAVVRHLTEELARREPDPALDAVLKAFPATAEIYENLRYEHAGLCRSPLETSLNAELDAAAAIRAARIG